LWVGNVSGAGTPRVCRFAGIAGHYSQAIVKDGGQVNQGIRQAWAGLTERVVTAVAARPSKLSWATLASGLRRWLEFAQPYLRVGLRMATVFLALLTGMIVLLVVAYRWINPPLSALMLGQSIAGTSIERSWVPLERISPQLIRAVVLSEDGRFCRHGGVDWGAIREAIAHDRGGSTITMQVVKNLFLWPSRSYVRKFIEIALAYLVEVAWPKRRILEIYLNIAEWGDGVFGAEAAAQTHFSKSAAQLTAAEAALLTVALPNPLERTPGEPSAGTSRLAERLLQRLNATQVELGCVRSGSLFATRPSLPASRPASKEQKPASGTSKGDWEYLFPSGD
jgi:monofunctional biosynthetic peptidoglycan transglycosylase